ncbi:MAG: SEL1-like repeat protein [Bryobacterales bacterium]|nr:SEL1-like repeat protein [Bryobacterales bacterium]
MSSRCVASLLLTLLLVALPLRAGLEEGLTAYRAGNFAVALKEFRVAAQAGNRTAMVSLGFMYLRGEGVDVDPREASHWLQLAAEQGVAPAQHSLALLYYEGRGVDRNATVAANYFESAALQGLADAQYNLGVLYARGDGVDKDWTLARFWYQKAAEQNLSDAQLALGVMAANGHGAPRDYEEAARWFGKAAAAGSSRAQRMLETAFSDLAATLPMPDPSPASANVAQTPTQAPPATGLPATHSDSSANTPSIDLPSHQAAGPDPFWENPPSPISDRAFRDLQGYAVAGDAAAQVTLAWHYLHGETAPQSMVRAYVWAERAARKGSTNGASLAKALRPRLTQRQQSAAKAILDGNSQSSP